MNESLQIVSCVNPSKLCHVWIPPNCVTPKAGDKAGIAENINNPAAPKKRGNLIHFISCLRISSEASLNKSLSKCRHGGPNAPVITSYRDKGSPHTILQLLPDECQQWEIQYCESSYRIFNLLFCVTVPVLHDMIVQSFIRSRGVLGDDSKPQEIVDKNLSLVCHWG